MTLEMKVLVALSVALVACAQSEAPQHHGGETNWLQACIAGDDACEQGACICGVCTKICDAASDCDADFSGVCTEAVSSTGDGQCASEPDPPVAICLPSCPEAGCGEGFECRTGVCVTE